VNDVYSGKVDGEDYTFGVYKGDDEKIYSFVKYLNGTVWYGGGIA